MRRHGLKAGKKSAILTRRRLLDVAILTSERSEKISFGFVSSFRNQTPGVRLTRANTTAAILERYLFPLRELKERDVIWQLWSQASATL